MTLRLVLVTCPEDSLRDLLDRVDDIPVLDLRVAPEQAAPKRGPGGKEGDAAGDTADTPGVTVRILADDKHRQALLDAIQATFALSADWRLTLLPVDATLPFPDDDKEEAEEAEENGKARKKGAGGRTREEIYNGVWADAQASLTYFVFVALSTVVAAFGMIDNSGAVVVGAMVIAPLLGPNLALAVGVALGDGRLIGRAALATGAGVSLAMALSLAIGFLVPLDPASAELASRAKVGFGAMAVALASGAAAALSLVSGVSSALVGVMVAVALLPPTVAVGLFLGAGDPHQALAAALLLAVNMVSINVAAQVVMVLRGITPRTWYERRKARRASRINAAISIALLLVLAALLWLKTQMG